MPKLRSTYVPEALDEINLFWIRYIDVVQLFLNTWFLDENSYVCTAGTLIKYEDDEHLPFLLMGNEHILDDPLGKYSEIQNKMQKGKDAEFLYGQIRETAENNLNLLENIQCEILVLPLRLISQSEDCNYLYVTGERFFVSLFKGIDNLNDYYAKCNSIKDIVCFARNDIGKLVMFFEDDDFTLPFEERFRVALAKMPYMVDESKPDSYNFFRFVYGRIMQAIDVIMSCIKYGCVPYIRYPVLFHYISLLLQCMLDIDRNYIAKLHFKMTVGYIVDLLCDKQKLSSVCLEKFLREKQSYNFSDRLFCALTEHGINENNFSKHTLEQLVVDELQSFYNKLYADNKTDTNKSISIES